MRIACLRHTAVDSPGGVSKWAAHNGYKLTLVDPYDGHELPSIDSFDLLVVLGGPMSVNDTESYSWLLDEQRLIVEAAESGKGVLGICMGGQQIAAALGAEVRSNGKLELGWWPVSQNADSEGTQLSKAFPREFFVFHSHSDTFDIPNGCTNLAASEACAHQAFEAFDGRVVALQFHPEMGVPEIGVIAESRRLETATSATVQTPNEYLTGDDVPERIAAMQRCLGDLLDGIAAHL